MNKNLKTVKAQFLLDGASFALKRCGELLTDSRMLFQEQRYATSLGLAALAREELGRARMLKEIWQATKEEGSISLNEVINKCEDHQTKQEYGQISVVIKWSNKGELGEIGNTLLSGNTQAPEFATAQSKMKQLSQKKKKRTPLDRHMLRTQAFYVEPKENGLGWSEPSKVISEETAREFLIEAINDYSLICGYQDPACSPHKFDAALQFWQQNPDLPPPPWLH